MTRRWEHHRLLMVNLEVDHQLDVEMWADQLSEEADAFGDTWSIDSDGHWHDRFDRRYASDQHPRFYFEIYDPVDLRIRRLQIAMPFSTPFVPPQRSVVQLQPFNADEPTPMEGVVRTRSISPQGRDASPMSVASTVPADFDPTLANFRPFPNLDAHSPDDLLPEEGA